MSIMNLDQFIDKYGNEEVSLSKQKNKSKSMKQEYLEGAIPDIFNALIPSCNPNKSNENEHFEKLVENIVAFSSDLYKLKAFHRAQNIELKNISDKLSSFGESQEVYDFIKKYPNYIYAPLRFIHENDEASTLEKYIDGIITKGDLAICAKYPLGISGWSENSTTHNPFWMSYLKGKVPVLLVPSALMPAGDGIDSLGCYIPNLSLRKPVIFLCPEKIKAEAKSKGISVKLLYATVLIHEFAHAVMDETNTLKDEDKKVVFEKKEVSVEISKPATYMEESLANMITLQYMEREVSDIKLTTIKNFMRNQPAHYAFGVDLFDANKDAILIDWRKWRTYKSNISKTNRKLNKWKTFADKYNLSKIDKNDIVNTFNTALS